LGVLKIKLDRQLVFYSSFVLLFATIFIRYVVQVDIPRLVFLGIVAVMAVSADEDELIAIPLCCIPLYTSIQYLYAVGICLIVMVGRFWSKIRLNLSLLPVLLLFFWEILHCFDAYSSIMEAVRVFVPFFLLGVLMCFPMKDLNYPKVVRLVANSTTFICVVLLVRVIQDANFNLQVAFLDMQRLGFVDESNEIVGAYLNPNTLGYFCIMAAIGLLQLITVRKHQASDVVMLVLLLVCGMMTMSRTYLVCLVVMLMLFLMVQKGTWMQKARNIVLLLVLFAVLALIMWLVFPAVAEAFLGRMQVDDISNGRNLLLVQYLERNFESMHSAFFGLGVQSLREKVTDFYGLSALVPHNGIQDIVTVWGLPGLALFVWILVEMCRRSRRWNPERRLINFIPLLLLLLKVQAGQLATSCYTLLIFSLAYLSLVYVFPSSEEKADPSQTEEKKVIPDE